MKIFEWQQSCLTTEWNEMVSDFKEYLFRPLFYPCIEFRVKAYVDYVPKTRFLLSAFLYFIQICCYFQPSCSEVKCYTTCLEKRSRAGGCAVPTTGAATAPKAPRGDSLWEGSPGRAQRWQSCPECQCSPVHPSGCRTAPAPAPYSFARPRVSRGRRLSAPCPGSLLVSAAQQITSLSASCTRVAYSQSYSHFPLFLMETDPTSYVRSYSW